ncbi:MAG: hypothetical protein ACLFTT_08860 [Candidatus Hydrogenedentota bacterium]
MKFSTQTMHQMLPALLGACLLALVSMGCQPPTLTSLTPSSGPPGTVVEIEGASLALASVIWDAATGSEQTLDSSFLSARFFTVPLDASTGDHPVALSGNGARSSTLNFNVTDGTVRPEPRLDDVTLSFFSIDGGSANMILMAHGANIDVGAEILVDGSAIDSAFSRVLRNNSMNATTASTLGYPIFHYATVWGPLNGQAPGDTIDVAVRNQDGETSNTLEYEIAATMAQLDSDGDGLPDEWEENGYDHDGDGNVDVDLPELGADPMRKDLFVEVDWMLDTTPNNGIWANIEDTFDRAPILNSDGSAGITAHIDRGAGSGGGGGDIIPFADGLRYDNATPNPLNTYANMSTLRSNNMDAARVPIYRYAVFGWDNGHSPGSSGRAEDIHASMFFVSLGTWGADGQREDFQTGTFLHELGHTLNLRHGGHENANEKDNYNSIMQYGEDWITWRGQSNVHGPSQMGGIDTDCDPFNVNGVYTYSQGQRAPLDESDLDENDGVCDGVSVDWNNNGAIEASVSQNLDTTGALTTIEDHADWANIRLDMP